jgi:hypothetical protein
MNSVWNGAGRRIELCDVGMRDGLQMECQFVPTEDKIALVNALSAAGLPKIEVTSFTSPTAIPALRDAEIVMREIERRPGTVYTALVPNARGAERAIEARTDELNLVMSVSETHNLCNLRMTRAQSFAALSRVIAMAQDARVAVNVSLSCVFGCPMEGDVPQEEAFAWVQRFAGLGVQGVTLCDGHGLSHAGGAAHGRCARALAGNGVHAAFPQHARHGPGQRARGHRRGREPLRRIAGRPGRLPLRAGRVGQRLHRGGGACAAAHGLWHGDRSARAAGRGAAPAGADRP